MLAAFPVVEYPAAVQPDKIQSALAEIASERDPTVKHLKLASLCSALFREKGFELVVVGGSAIEFYTEGAYTSGDVDLCIASSTQPLTVRLRQETMGQLKAEGGPRSWQVAGAFIDILGPFENFARTPIRRLAGAFGEIWIGPVEELIVERILVAHYPHPHPPAAEAAHKLIAASLQEEIAVDWSEVQRLATTSAYANWPQVRQTVYAQAKALQIRSPYDSDE